MKNKTREGIVRYFIIGVLLSCLLATAGQAQFVTDQTTFHDLDCDFPALASSPDGTAMLAYVATDPSLLTSFVEVQYMLTSRTDAYFPSDPIVFNSGSAPAITWSWSGYHLAFAHEEMILIYHSDPYGNWDLDNYTTLETNGTVRNLDILGASWDSGGPCIFLAVHTLTDAPENPFSIQFASCDQNGWTQLECLDLDPVMTNPQLALVGGAYTPTPVLYYQGGESIAEPQLKSTTKQGAPQVWSEPTLIVDDNGIPSPIVNYFDIATSWDTGDIHLLGLGAFPACPCGSIHHHSYSFSDDLWSVEYVTAQYADYDWPMPPKIAMTEGGQGHAFWFQLASAGNLMPWRKTLEYRTFEDGDWVNAGDFLNEPGHGGPIGAFVALTVDPLNKPVLAWTRRDTIQGQPQPQQIWIARKFCLSDVQDSEVAQARMTLSAWPNPFNPVVKIAFEVDQAQTVRLDVFDARGRRVANLLERVVDAGRSEVSWNATNDSGRQLPSGVYFARMVSGGEKVVVKLVLAE